MKEAIALLERSYEELANLDVDAEGALFEQSSKLATELTIQVRSHFELK